MRKHDLRPDDFFMRRALEIARYGHGQVSPNPLVGCVIVHDKKIIGEGWHRKFGEAHAEVNAVQSVEKKDLLAESTVYVTLEPCSHYGKTPPCADMLIAQRVRKVVISNLDCNPLVSGRGVARLKASGIEVSHGILEAEGSSLNRRFFTMMKEKRPYIVLKWAQTADGFMARETYDSKWISNVFSRQLTHKWRTEEDAILVGTTTALRDNPQLTVRDWSGRNPIRIVIDRNLRLDHSIHLFDGNAKTICYNTHSDREQGNVSFVRIQDDDFTGNMINDLYERRIQSVLVEGGPTTLNHFIDAGLWDEARIFTSGQRFGKGVGAPSVKGSVETYNVVDDTLTLVSRTG